MKIAIISAVLPYHGGMGRVLDAEANELYKNNIDFTVFVPDYGKKIDVPYYVEYLKPFIQIGFGAICLDLLKKIKQGNFDYIYIHYPAYGLAEQFLFFNKKNPKLFIRYHMDTIGDTKFKKIFFKLHSRLILPLLLKKSDKILFSTLDYGKCSYAKDFIYKSEEVPFGIDKSKFYFDNNIQKENQILFVAKLDRQHYFKGLDNLLKAFSQINSKNIILKIIGSGDMEGYYKEKAKELNISDKVIFLGYCSDEKMRDEYQKSIVTILPSIDKSEAFGLTLIESMACGTPVIASNLPGVRTIVGDERFICKAGDIMSLRQCIEKMINLYINNREEYNSIRSKYLEDIQTKYNWDNILKIFRY